MYVQFILRSLKDSDYNDILVGWWHDWGWEAPIQDFLPDNGSGGMIVYDGDIPVCAGFVYTTNSKVAWVDWIISNKEYQKKPQRGEAIKLLIHTLSSIAKNAGSKYAYALIKNESLIDTYKELGYIQADNYTSEMIKLL